jgi:hypothetical protein
MSGEIYASVRTFERVPDRPGIWRLTFACATRAAFDAVKTEVNATAGVGWNDTDKAWHVPEASIKKLARWWPDLEVFCEAYHLPVLERPQSERTAKSVPVYMNPASLPTWGPEDVASAFSALYLRPDAPPAVVQAVYRVLSKTAHPDLGGTHDEMVQLTEDYETALQWAQQHAE